MTVWLEIPDGDPWWKSPNVWVAREGWLERLEQVVMGVPVVLWARVRNDGDEPAEGAVVQFYSGDPDLLIDRRSARRLGHTRVRIPAGEAATAPVPWTPGPAELGRVVVLAEAFHRPEDPLSPGTVFDVPADRHVAQSELWVVPPPRRAAWPRGDPSAP